MSQSLYILSRHAVAKLFILGIGFVTTILSYYAYTDSPWNKDRLEEKCREHGYHGLKELRWKGTADHEYFMSTENCASIVEERILFWGNVFIFSLSVALMIGCCIADIDSVNAIRNRDAFLHFFSAIVLIIVAVVQLIAVTKIGSNECHVREKEHLDKVLSVNCATYLQLTHKYWAAGLTIGLAVCYISTACVVENTRLYGMDAPRIFRSRTNVPQTAPSILTGAAARRRSSAVSLSQAASRLGQTSPKKKAGGLGGFGAVTANRPGNRHVPVDTPDEVKGERRESSA